MMAAARPLAANGVIALTGIPAEGAAEKINVGRALRDMVLKNQVVFGTVNAGRRDYRAAIQLLEQFMVLFPESVRRLITRRRPLDEASRMLKQGEGIKNVVQLSLRAA
jgi:threonine dehydrogenase-like Zn-dependent dehydrogenase